MDRTILNNVEALLKIHGNQKASLDKFLGRAAGYLTRKHDYGQLTLAEVEKISGFFGIPSEDLKTNNYNMVYELTEAEKKVNVAKQKLMEAEEEYNGLLNKYGKTM